MLAAHCGAGRETVIVGHRSGRKNSWLFPYSGPETRGALARTGWCRPLRHPSHPASVGLACRPVGAWRRHLVKQLDSTRGGPGHGHIVIGGGLAAVRASGAVYAVDNGLSDSPCQIRFRRVRIARTMEESAGLTRLRKGAGDESEGGRLPGGQGHDYRTA